MQIRIPVAFAVSLLMCTSYIYSVCPDYGPIVVDPYTPVNPQVGENIWHITSRIGAAVDDLAGISAQAVEGANDMLYTNSLCCDCTCFVTQADVEAGYVIDQPGVYCVAEDINVTSAPFLQLIRIASSDVVLDFRGNTISTSNVTEVVSLDDSFNAVIIRNGILEGNGSSNTGITLGVNCNDITIENCHVQGMAVAGVASTGTTSLKINNCSVSNSGGGFSLNAVDGVVIKNCMAKSNAGDGFGLTNESINVFLKSCYAVENVTGFNTSIDSSYITVNKCAAGTCSGDGFAIESDATALTNCAAIDNTGSGFRLNQAALSKHISLLGSVAYRNAGTGIVNGGATSLVFNNISSVNIAGNYSGVTAATLVAPASVTAATGYWANING